MASLTDLGVSIGTLPSGPTRSILDVPGVGLGHSTVVYDDAPPPFGRGVARTGVTVIDLGGDAWESPVPAGVAVLNGAGELTGRSQIDEWGLLETPVFLTSTMQVGRVYDAAARLLMAEQPRIGVDDVIIPVVGECDDSWLNDPRHMHVTDEHIAAALASARTSAGGHGVPDQGAVGAGTGMSCFGWKGGIGNHVGYIFFVGLFGVSAGLAGILIAFRDADPEAEAQIVHTATVPAAPVPVGANFMPALTAFGFVLMIVGLATRTPLYATIGLVVVICAAFVWTLRAWAERATGDDTANADLYHRFIDPLRTPVIAILSIAVVAIGLSRLLLSVSKTNSVIVFGVVAALFFIVATILALRPSSRCSSSSAPSPSSPPESWVRSTASGSSRSIPPPSPVPPPRAQPHFRSPS